MAGVYGETAEQLPDSGIFHPHDCDGNRDPRGHVDICDRLEMTLRTSEAWPLALTMGQNSSILPVLPMRKELRTMPIKVRPMNCFFCQAPNLAMVLCVGSESKGKLSSCLALNAACALTGSAL